MHPICALKWMSGCENVWAGETGERSKTKHPLPIVLSSRFPNTNQVSSNMCWTSSGLASIRPHRACVYSVYSLYIKLRGSLLQYFGGQLVTLCRLWVQWKLFNIEHTALQRYLYSEPFLEQKLNPSSVIAVHTVTCTPSLQRGREPSGDSPLVNTPFMNRLSCTITMVVHLGQ